jgi:hypothetical protein
MICLFHVKSISIPVRNKARSKTTFHQTPLSLNYIAHGKSGIHTGRGMEWISFIHHRLHTPSGTHAVSYAVGTVNCSLWDKAAGGVKLTTHIHV